MTVKVQHIHTCTGHNGALYALAKGQSPRHFLSAGSDGWLVEWHLDEPEMGKLVASVENQVFSLTHLPDSNRLVAGNMNGGMHWVNRAEPERTRNLQFHQKGVYALVPYKDWVFSGGGDGFLTRWDAHTGNSIESLQCSHQSIRAIAVSEKRQEIAVGSSDNCIYLLDIQTLAVKKVLQDAHSNSIFTLAYTPDAQSLVSGGRDAMLRVWDIENDWTLQSEQAAHLFTINHLVFSPDGQLLATASRDRTLKIWDAHTFELLKVVDTLRFGSHARSVNRLLWLPDALISCSDDGLAMIWEISV